MFFFLNLCYCHILDYPSVSCHLLVITIIVYTCTWSVSNRVHISQIKQKMPRLFSIQNTEIWTEKLFLSKELTAELKCISWTKLIKLIDNEYAAGLWHHNWNITVCSKQTVDFEPDHTCQLESTSIVKQNFALSSNLGPFIVLYIYIYIFIYIFIKPLMKVRIESKAKATRFNLYIYIYIYIWMVYIYIYPSKKFCNSSLRGNISLVASSSYVNVVSLESLIIPLYNDVSFVMLMQSWNAQSFWVCSKVKNELLQNLLFLIVNSRLFWGWIEFEWCWYGDAWKSTHGVFS